MKPGPRFLVTGLVLVAIMTAAAAAGVIWQSHREAQADVVHRLQAAAGVESALQSNRFETLALHARAMADDSAFVAYVAHALLPDPSLGGKPDAASISDLLRLRRHGYALAMVLDRQGKSVAVSGTIIQNRDRIAQGPLVARVLSSGKTAQGLWVDNGHLLQVVVTPLSRGGALQGLLLVADPLDDAFAIAVGRLSGTDVALIAGTAQATVSAHSSDLSPWQDKALDKNASNIVAVDDSQGTAVTLTDTQQTTVAWVTPVHVAEGHAVMAALDRNADTENLVPSAAWPLLYGVALLGMFAAACVVILWRRTWLPLQDMQDVIERAAQGDHFLHLQGSGSPIVRHLRDAINRLLNQNRK